MKREEHDWFDDARNNFLVDIQIIFYVATLETLQMSRLEHVDDELIFDFLIVRR